MRTPRTLIVDEKLDSIEARIEALENILKPAHRGTSDDIPVYQK